MALGIISNFAANSAQRNLITTEMRATSSLQKLSSGTRVNAAKDDAASLAIGSRLRAEVKALEVAVVNSGQASSMLQIADGAMATIDTILVRMKQLAVQAASDNVSNTERTFVFNEFNALRNEIDRIAADTEFNGTKLLNGTTTFSASGFGTDIEAGDGFVEFAFEADAPNVATGNTFEIDYASGPTSVMTVTNTATGLAETVTISGSPAAGSTLDVDFTKFGLTITLSNDFNAAGTINANNTFSVAGATNDTSLSFKIGTGNVTAEDDIAITLSQANVNSLNTTLNTINFSNSVANANSAIDLVGSAIDQLNTARADIGAFQNRLEFAASNIRISVENSEAARSTLLDLNVASEISNFTSQQIVLQAGVSMLAQANQLPQNLLRLFQ
ncbi:MAG: flagellin [Acetobacterales bacterium]